MKGCKVEGSKFISVDTIWSILETKLLKLIRVNAFYVISDPQLVQMYAKINPKWSMGTSRWTIGGQNVPDGAKWTLGAPRCAQREVKVRQDGPKRGPKELLGTPRGAQGSPRGPRMSPKGAQGKPKVSPRGSKGAKVDAQEGQNMNKNDCSKSLKTLSFTSKMKIWS